MTRRNSIIYICECGTKYRVFHNGSIETHTDKDPVFSPQEVEHAIIVDSRKGDDGA